tara:strand:+ start:280 stop:2403 length:2124 start_codon:yes stop_codon:yes gene_type:complete
MPDLKVKRAPQTDVNRRAWETVYDDINDIINSVNQKSAVESRNGASGGDGDIRLFKDVDKTKYFIEGKFTDGWAKRELLFSDLNNDTQDESINFSATESYVKPDGTVPFTGQILGIAPTNSLHLTTKGYADTGRLISVSKSSNNLIFGMTNTASNITFTGFGSNAYNSTSIPTTFVASLADSASGSGIVGLVDDSTGTIYSLKGGDNIAINVEGSESSDYVEIDCSINTSNFLATGVNRVEGIKTFDTDAITDTQSMSSGAYIVVDDDNSNVAVTFSTVTLANGSSLPSVRLNGASAYTHPVSAGNKHVPTGGSSGEFLKYSSSGTAVWATPSYTTNTNDYITGASISDQGVLTLSGGGSSGAIVDLSEEFLLASAGGGALTASSTHTLTNKSGNNTQWTNGAGYITGSSSSLLTNKTGVISMWTNDSGYLTASHTSNASAHHTRYADSEATAAMGTKGDSNALNHDKYTNANAVSAVNATSSITTTCDSPDVNHNTDINWNCGTISGTAANARTTIELASDDDVQFNSLGVGVAASGAGDVRIANNLWINGYTDSTASRIRFHHDTNNAYQDWETGNYYIRYDTATKYMMDSSGNFHADNDVYAYSTSVGSDKKLKKNIKDIKYGLSDILKLRGVDFDWKEKRDGVHDIGVIAQEVRKVIPEVVQEVDDLVEDTYLSVDYAKLVPVLIEAIKELNDKGCKCGVRKS